MSTIVVVLWFHSSSQKIDIEIPDSISANEFVIALNDAYHLGIDTSNLAECFLKSENPIALLKGNKTLKEYGLRNGSIIHIL